MKRFTILALGAIAVLLSCGGGRGTEAGDAASNSASEAAARGGQARRERGFSPADVVIAKQLLYNQHTLADTFPYHKGVRVFQFDKMRRRLFVLDSIQQSPSSWAVLQNRKNMHGLAPAVKDWTTDEYHTLADRYGVQQRQSAPLYRAGEATPERYGRDGSLVKLLGYSADSTRYKVESYNAPGVWEVPLKFVKPLSKESFTKVVMVDRTNQDIATLDRTDRGRWLVRSMNPCTTGEHTPPHAYPTPEGMFVIQDREPKMLYDNGGPVIVGFAPWASRFTNGAFLHGVPVNNPGGAIVEFSPTLGTIPRSHECVRNASSHAKFIYDWAPLGETIVFVYD